MKFRLRYKGTLDLRNEDRVGLKHRLRRYFHPQLRFVCEQMVRSQNDYRSENQSLWTPFKHSEREGDVTLLVARGSYTFAPLVSQARGWNAVARLDILFLRPESDGVLLRKSGDLDNRIKLLIDGLRMPQNSDELPKVSKPETGEDPFYCLLQDDSLVTAINIEADQLLDPPDQYSVEVLIGVEVRCTFRSTFNSPIW